MTATMPERRLGQDLIRLYLPEELKERFKRLCSIKGTTMTEEVTEFIEQSLKDNDELLKLVDKKLKKKL
jgi:predicted DNA-binding protein